MPHLEVISPGFYTTIQDAGRPGFSRFGFPVSGAMDQRLMIFANLLTGNKPNSAVLEMALQGGQFLFHHPTHIAITAVGADVLVNEKSAPLHQTLNINAGDELEIGRITAGNYAYMAVSGGLDVPDFLGSFSTLEISGKGGFHGRIMQKQDILKYKSPEHKSEVFRIRDEFRPVPAKGSQIFRALCGPEFHLLSKNAQQLFPSLFFKIDDKINRMGFRVHCPGLELTNSDISSSATMPGIIQSTGNGQAIVLQRDAQVSGGYPRIAKILNCDMPRFSQLKPGSIFSISFVKPKEAEHANRYHQNMYQYALEKS